MNEAGEVDEAAIVTSGEASEMLETANASLDLIAIFVDACIMRDGDPAVALGGDHRLGVHCRDLTT
ncbi:hypothetical protein [Sphingomonas sp. PB1R3]|uniref:hypothetical protein n=1 Tax=Sphingomonas flavida TaxID=3096154 RepID=UPI002FCAE2B0